ncbi:hypothetical protein [Haliscomenobacter sp.]|uniref:hypothetical protein n=1 Tax=Haliscomenobacter sp. TaxID=2717303 RepID=UPI00336502B8
MFKPKPSSLFGFLWGIALLAVTELPAQNENSAAFNTPLFEKINVDPVYGSAYANYRINTIELASFALRDAYVSPLRLDGVGVKASFCQLLYTPIALKELNSSFLAGTAFDGAQDFNLSVLNFAVNYSWQFPVWQQKSWRGYVGPWLQGYGNFRLALQNVNNVIGYDAGFELGPKGRLEYKFKPGRKEYTLTQELSVPVLGTFVRPLYTFTGPIVGETDQEVSVLQTGTLNRRFGWVYKASLDFYRNRKKKKQVVAKIPYRISYSFQYDQYSKPNPAQFAIQTITISKIIKH